MKNSSSACRSIICFIQKTAQYTLYVCPTKHALLNLFKVFMYKYCMYCVNIMYPHAVKESYPQIFTYSQLTESVKKKKKEKGWGEAGRRGGIIHQCGRCYNKVFFKIWEEKKISGEYWTQDKFTNSDQLRKKKKKERNFLIFLFLPIFSKATVEKRTHKNFDNDFSPIDTRQGWQFSALTYMNSLRILCIIVQCWQPFMLLHSENMCVHFMAELHQVNK